MWDSYRLKMAKFKIVRIHVMYDSEKNKFEIQTFRTMRCTLFVWVCTLCAHTIQQFEFFTDGSIAMPYSRIVVCLPSYSVSSIFGVVHFINLLSIFRILCYLLVFPLPLHFYPFNLLLLLLYNFSAHIVRFEMKTDIDK